MKNQISDSFLRMRSVSGILTLSVLVSLTTQAAERAGSGNPIPVSAQSTDPATSGKTVPPVGANGANPSSAGALSVDDAITQAQAHNPELNRMKIETDAADWKVKQQLGGFLPHVGLVADHFLASQPTSMTVNFGGPITFPGAYPQDDIKLEASINLFDGFATTNRYRAASLESEAAALQFNHAKFRMENEIRIKFSDALSAQELAKVADQNIETLETHLKLARASESAGVSTRVDVLRIESQLEEARAERILAYDDVAIKRKALHEAMGEEDDERPLDGKLPLPSSYTLPLDLQFHLEDRKDVQAQSKREMASTKLASAASSHWIPQLSVFGNEEFYKFGSFSAPMVLPQDSLQNAYALGLRLSWDIYDGGASIAKDHIAADEARQSAEVSRQGVLKAKDEFDNWKRRFIYNSALFQARGRAVQKSEESVRLATIAVKAGTKTHSDVLDAELELFRARAGVIRAQVDAVESFHRVELAVGHPI